MKKTSKNNIVHVIRKSNTSLSREIFLLSILKRNVSIKEFDNRFEIVSKCQEVVDLYKKKYGNSIRFDVITIPDLRTDVVFYIFNNKKSGDENYIVLDKKTKNKVDKYWDFWHESIGKIIGNSPKNDIKESMVKLEYELRLMILEDREFIKNLYNKNLELSYRKKIPFLWGFCVENQTDFNLMVKAAEIEFENRKDFTVLNEFAKSFIKNSEFNVPATFLGKLLISPSIPLIQKILSILKEKKSLIASKSISSKIRIVSELNFLQISYFKKYFKNYSSLNNSKIYSDNLVKL